MVSRYREIAVNKRWQWRGAILGLVLVTVMLSCGGETEEASRHEVPIFIDGTGIDRFETDRGYEVDIDVVKLGIERVEFTVGGEEHARSQEWRQWLQRGLLPVAVAHPNHASGGEVAGEFVGPVVAQFRSGELEEIGTAIFLEGDYAGYNVTFMGEDGSTADAELLEPGLLGRIRGEVAKDGEEIGFVVEAAHFSSADVIGGGFAGSINDGQTTGVALEFLTVAPGLGTTIFDGVQFSQLEADEEGTVWIEDGSLAHAEIRSAMTSHQFYSGRILNQQ